MSDPPAFINSGELIFNHIFLPWPRNERNLPARARNYMNFISKIFLHRGENRLGQQTGELAGFRFLKIVRAMKKYSLNQHVSTKSSLTVTHTAGIFQSQRV